MVELNEKALEAAHHAYQTHEQMGHLKAQRLSDSCLTAVITAYLAALPAPDDGLVERLRNVSNMINMGEGIRWGEETALMDQAAAALQSKDEQIERLTRERGEWIERCRAAVIAFDEQKARAEAAEQQVQKLTAENERLREALMAAREVLQEDRDELFDSVTVAGIAATMDEIDRPHVDRMDAILSSIDASLETQEGGK